MTNICLSGGADGADIEWGKCAQAIGHKVIHWSFEGHGSKAPTNQVIKLNNEQLERSNDALEKAAGTLGKQLPKRSNISPLLQRDYYQVLKTESCYAVTTIRTDIKPGGTAWAVTMFTQLHPGNLKLYVFDQEKDAWFQFNGNSWDSIDSPPRPTGIWTGIGTRNLLQNGVDAIRKLMGRSVGLPDSLEEAADESTTPEEWDELVEGLVDHG